MRGNDTHRMYHWTSPYPVLPSLRKFVFIPHESTRETRYHIMAAIQLWSSSLRSVYIGTYDLPSNILMTTLTMCASLKYYRAYHPLVPMVMPLSMMCMLYGSITSVTSTSLTDLNLPFMPLQAIRMLSLHRYSNIYL